jgi:hypothetical protein
MVSRGPPGIRHPVKPLPPFDDAPRDHAAEVINGLLPSHRLG